MKKVSVIIPAYNCERFVEKSVRSILAQSYQNLEILICDDGSTDATKTVLDKFSDPRIVRLDNATNRGNVFTRNKLFGQATGDYLCIQDADDWSDEDRISRQLAQMNQDHVQVVGTNFYRVYDGHKVLKHPFEDYVMERGTYEKFRFALASVMLTKEVYQSIGPIPQLLEKMIAEDNYWLTKINEAYDISVIGSPLYYYRDVVGSLTRKFNRENLTAVPLIKELKRQRQASGTDWVEQNNANAIRNFKEQLLSDANWLSHELLKKAINMVDTEPNQAKKIVTEVKGLLGLKLYSKRLYWNYLKARIRG